MTQSRESDSPNSSTPTLPRCPAGSSNGCWSRGHLPATRTSWSWTSPPRELTLSISACLPVSWLSGCRQAPPYSWSCMMSARPAALIDRAVVLSDGRVAHDGPLGDLGQHHRRLGGHEHIDHGRTAADDHGEG